MSTVIERHPIGYSSLSGLNAEQAFSSLELSDRALTAGVRLSKRFDKSFPGWELYRRVVAGVDLYDKVLENWAVSTAIMLSRCKKLSGLDYIRQDTRKKNGWIEQAGRDALDHAIYRRFPATVDDRSKYFHVGHETYRAIRDPVAAGMHIGLETFSSLIHAEYFQVRREEFRGC